MLPVGKPNLKYILSIPNITPLDKGASLKSGSNIPPSPYKKTYNSALWIRRSEQVRIILRCKFYLVNTSVTILQI